MWDKLKGLKGFVFEEDANNAINIPAELTEFNTVEVDMPETLNTEQVTIPEIYQQFDITYDNSIFKVKDFMKTLPDSLPTDTKRQTLLGVLTVSNLQIENLLEDAQIRINALNAVAEKCYTDTNEKISTNEQEIMKLMERIDVLKKENNDGKKLQEVQVTMINEEIKKINEITDFINPNK